MEIKEAEMLKKEIPMDKKAMDSAQMDLVKVENQMIKKDDLLNGKI